MTYNRQIEAKKRTHLTAPASHPEWNEGSQCAKQSQISAFSSEYQGWPEKQTQNKAKSA
jgi:hypothetical protein